MEKRPNFVIISGPSGAGEDSVINGLANIIPIERVITTVTRKMRPGEKEGDPYYFITEEKFKQIIQDGEFFEYAQHYNNNLYGTTKAEMVPTWNSTG